MKNAVNFVLFQLFWFAAVLGAESGYLWAGPVAVVVFLGVHLRMVAAGQRARELGFVLVVGVAGTFADSVLAALDVLRYPTSTAWTPPIVPPWITSLWIGFAMLPRFSLGWLANRPALTAAFGAVGGPLSFLGGARIGAVALGANPTITLAALAIEYALVTPALLHWAPGQREARDGAAADRRPVAGEPRTREGSTETASVR